MTTKDEALKSLHEASLSIACLCADGTEQDSEGLQNDLNHIQDQITILENFLDPDSSYNPYAPRRKTDA